MTDYSKIKELIQDTDAIIIGEGQDYPPLLESTMEKKTLLNFSQN